MSTELDQTTPEDYAALVIPLPAYDPASGGSADTGQVSDYQPRQKQVEPRVITRHPFEVYIVGQDAGGVLSVKCAWGSCGSMTDAETTDAITNLDTAITLPSTLPPTQPWLIWIEAKFEADGGFNSLTLKHGDPTANGWGDYPNMSTEIGGGGNYWFHPIAQICPSRTDPPSSGEVVIGDGNTIINQLTNTHLRSIAFCSAGSSSQWKLEPGSGIVRV